MNDLKEEELMCCGMPISEFMKLGSVECMRLHKEENERFYASIKKDKYGKSKLERDFMKESHIRTLIGMGVCKEKALSLIEENREKIKEIEHNWFILYICLDKLSGKEKEVEIEASNQKTYLMRNNQNGYYKIGKSINPKHREGTLQAQEPDIELIATCDKDIEKDLHKKFDAHRLRGEWFELSEPNVSDIINNYFRSDKGHLVDDGQLDMFKGGESNG